MLRSAVVILIFATLAAARSPRFRVVNGEQIGTVVNGEVVNPGTFPYITYLHITKYQYSYSNDTYGEITIFSGRCTGTLIRENTVLTAAHCVIGANPDNVTIAAGIVTVDRPQKYAQIRYARRYVIHEQFNGTWEYDIAMVFVLIRFRFNKYVGKLDLAQPDDYKIGMTAVASGWGTNVNGTVSNWLNSAELTLVDNSLCEKYNTSIDYSSLICVIDTANRTTVCNGDSGGPLVKDNVLIGVLDGIFRIENSERPDNGSCDPRLPATCSKVANFRSWIDTQFWLDAKYHL